MKTKKELYQFVYTCYNETLSTVEHKSDKSDKIPFLQRLLAIWYILTRKEFILITKFDIEHNGIKNFLMLNRNELSTKDLSKVYYIAFMQEYLAIDRKVIDEKLDVS